MSFRIRDWQVIAVIVLILTVIGLVLEGSITLFYGSIGAGSIYLYHKSQSEKYSENERNYNRLAWLFTKLSPLNPSMRYNAKRVQELIDNQGIIQLQGLSHAALGIESFEVPRQNKLPDLSEAEVEMANLEERASILLGSLVFIPVLFALMHVFRYVPIYAFLLELTSAITLGLALLNTQKISYQLSGWDRIYDFLSTNQVNLTVNPRKFLIYHELTRDWYQTQKIGFDNVPSNLLPSEFFLFLITKLVIDLDPDLRESYLLKILDEIESLPGKEAIVTEKWNAYKTRLFLISISSTALAGLFSSISSFNVEVLSTVTFTLETTPYLVWGELLLVLILNLFVFRMWYKMEKSLLYGSLLIIVYFAMYFLNALLI